MNPATTASLVDAHHRLAEHDAIDKAKRILMDNCRFAEPKPYAEMRKAALDQGRRIAKIADAIVSAHKLIGG